MSVRQLVRDFAYRHVGGTGLVLIYHRVADLGSDPQRLAVTPAVFDAQMDVLAKQFRVVELAELTDDLHAGRVSPRTVAVTFDDGYADNLLTAAPMLETHRVPATVFVSSGYMDGGRELWWDEIERLVLSPGELPRHIELATGEGGARFAADLTGTATYTPELVASAAGWDVTRGGGDERQRLYAGLCDWVRPLPVAGRDLVLEQLRELAGAESAVRETHRTLTSAEVRALDALPHMEVGGHTTGHVLLSAQDDNEQRSQVAGDRAALTAVLGREPALFSYPYGGLDSYTRATSAMVSEAGYTAACANHTGVVKPWTDPLRIPRLAVGDAGRDEFTALLEGWFRDPR